MKARALLVWLSPLTLCACNFAPDYAPPAIEVPVKFKEAKSWAQATPRDDAPRGPWWRGLNDKALNELEPQVDVGNQNLAAHLAILDQARAYTAQAQAGLFPTVNLNNSYSANKQSAHRPLRTSNRVPTAQGYEEALIDGRPFNQPDHYGNNLLTLQSSYEVDLWGRVRDSIAAREAQILASAADLESIRLSLQAELARTYIALRGLDAEIALFDRVVENYRVALSLVKTLVQGNIGAPADVPRAEAQLEVARARRDDLMARRAMYEHAIATLIGKPASSFSIRPATAQLGQPTVPPSAPLSLLERRPDVAAAERRVAAANQTIGVARAAFFPRLTINLSGGTQDTGLSLLNFKNSIWSVGPAVTLPIFDAGLRRAELAGAEAAYMQTVAEYRGAVLRAYQEVEDSLANLRWLSKEAQSLSIAVASTQKVLDTTLTLYREGATNYLDVITAQTAALDAQDALVTLKTRRVQAAVSLMLALGGGWSASLLEQVDPTPPAPTMPLEQAGLFGDKL
ncbi:efflux transporter outer membrane subunit [Methylocystis sp. MJC1]|jgi:NodT family efflux transporter outer membrane factor (OMF) lipoprotein|uniref:efflux transporter outer membrane subunit n=1 Tax=Methylocystis sp. MJC1 TaxID=2654282 RepID=UPI0013EA8F07|nr:efflux transporter outer membrane subunit [Methylocystis sp. MJC1]KAF2989972.1 Outer membrane protein OprM [Methylocystis sp. MJC1]MBU6528822.1 efflux transporter outer membrane subunit [Methylocystis sp. MJC1]UZX11706.1 efflux transporter outer membrane subunit [Methylocystis sp. MJC1]